MEERSGEAFAGTEPLIVIGNLMVVQYLAKHIPSAEFETVNRGVHMLFWERPVETGSAIVEFLRRHQSEEGPQCLA
jgi:pimeloyl-ACP methyl ester carboxylesterase